MFERRLALVAAVLACSLLGRSEVRAQSPARDSTAAEAFFTEGRALLKAGRVAEACAKLEASQKLDPADGTLLNLGDCYEKANRLASAWLAFREAASTAAAAGKTARAAHARDRAAAVEPRLCTLVVNVESPRTGEVYRDDVRLDPLTFGASLPVDAGKHTVSVRSSGAILFQRDVELVPAKGRCTEEIAIPPLASLTPAQGPAPVIAPSAGTTPHRAVEPTAKRSVLPLVMAGTGIVALGVSAGLGFHARGVWEDAKSKCEPRGCGDEAQSIADDARREAAIGTGVFITGAALLAGGLAWWWLSRSPSTSAMTLSPGASPHARSLVILGHF